MCECGKRESASYLKWPASWLYCHRRALSYGKVSCRKRFHPNSYSQIWSLSPVKAMIHQYLSALSATTTLLLDWRIHRLQTVLGKYTYLHPHHFTYIVMSALTPVISDRSVFPPMVCGKSKNTCCHVFSSLPSIECFIWIFSIHPLKG